MFVGARKKKYGAAVYFCQRSKEWFFRYDFLFNQAELDGKALNLPVDLYSNS